MSTTPVTPDQSSLAAAVPSSAPSNYVEQSSQNPAPTQSSAPAVAGNGPRLTSVLSAIVGASQNNTPSPAPAIPASNTSPQPAWKRDLGAVARTVSTGLAGIPAGGRPSFMGGLGQGARSEQQAQQQAQAIKFKTFQDSVQAAQLHNEDVRMQMATDDHQNAVQDQTDAEAKRMTDTTGMTYTKVPNTAENVKTYIATDQAQNGAASVPSGIIFGPHSLYIPNKSSADQAQADTKNYNWLAPAYGMGSVQPGQVVQPAANNMLRQARNGMDNQGHPMSAADIGNRVDNLTSYLKANSGAIPTEASSAIQSDIDHLTDLQTHHASRDQAGIDQATANAVDKAKQLGAVQTANKEAVQNNAAANKPTKTDTTMYIGSDANGNQVAGSAAQLQAAGVQGVTKLPTDTTSKVIAARELISPDGLFNSVAQNIQALQAKGNLGVVGSRWNDFLAGKVGDGDPDFQALRTNMGLLSTKLMQAHVGSRGSAQMLEHFQHLADYRITDAKTLLSALSAEHKYMTSTAAMPKQQTQSGGQ